jgi:fido (protein-threonine AMPylation protein)
MNFILNQKYSDGNTPIRPEEAEQLIPRISTMGELNEYEALNILRAREWAFDSRTMKSTDPLEEPYVRELHHRMFDNVWKWAGTYRQTERRVYEIKGGATGYERPKSLQIDRREYNNAGQ